MCRQFRKHFSCGHVDTDVVDCEAVLKGESTYPHDEDMVIEEWDFVNKCFGCKMREAMIRNGYAFLENGQPRTRQG